MKVNSNKKLQINFSFEGKIIKIRKINKYFFGEIIINQNYKEYKNN